MTTNIMYCLTIRIGDCPEDSMVSTIAASNDKRILDGIRLDLMNAIMKSYDDVRRVISLYNLKNIPNVRTEDFEEMYRGRRFKLSIVEVPHFSIER